MFPRVKDVVIAFEILGLEGVKQYFDQEGMTVNPNTWCANIKKRIDEGHEISVILEIELIREKLNFYKNVSEKTNRDESGTVIRKGNKEDKR